MNLWEQTLHFNCLFHNYNTFHFEIAVQTIILQARCQEDEEPGIVC